MADQVEGERLGNINHILYELRYGKDGLVDVTIGNNTFGPFTNPSDPPGVTHTVVGFSAGPGYDLASGLGTINAAKFVFAPAGEGED
jgi:hypothetical protein